METMPLTFGWNALALRLGLTLIAGALIGLNRGEHGRPAGLRTTMLVCLAAALAMIEMNLLLPMAGKGSDSFITNDLMRLPLGILSGMGFIGAGAILRKGDMVTGVTTAATLWIVTVIGLCFGGGQLWLGAIGTVLSLLVLWALKRGEALMPQERRAFLGLRLESGDLAISSICNRLSADGFEAWIEALEFDATGCHLSLELRWRSRADAVPIPSCIDELASWPGVASLKWAYRTPLPL